MNAKSTLEIELTPEQKKQTEQSMEEVVRPVKLTLQELDRRVVPALIIA